MMHLLVRIPTERSYAPVWSGCNKSVCATNEDLCPQQEDTNHPIMVKTNKPKTVYQDQKYFVVTCGRADPGGSMMELTSLSEALI